MRVLAVEVAIGGARHLAVIDTGASGDLLALSEVPMTGAEEPIRAKALGQSGDLVRRRLGAPLQIGGWLIEDVSVFTPRLTVPSPAGGPDLLVGNGILARWPMWIDFSAREVRWLMRD